MPVTWAKLDGRDSDGINRKERVWSPVLGLWIPPVSTRKRCLVRTQMQPGSSLVPAVTDSHVNPSGLFKDGNLARAGLGEKRS